MGSFSKICQSHFCLCKNTIKLHNLISVIIYYKEKVENKTQLTQNVMSKTNKLQSQIESKSDILDKNNLLHIKDMSNSSNLVEDSVHKR